MTPDDSACLAQRALDFIAEGVLIINQNGVIQFANPAAATMTGYGAPANIVGLSYQSVLRLEDANETPVEADKNPLFLALAANQSLSARDYLMVSAQAEHRIAIELTCIPTGGAHEDRIVTFRDITKELAEENEQTEFISTASHEMRTPVASIEGYLGLALNPQTATIDARARQYLDAAHASSQHLGRLFKDLLDVTKLEDNRLKPRLVPVDAVEIVKQISDEREKDVRAKKLKYSFGADGSAGGDKKRVEPKVYMATDIDFLREILDNLIENAVKYTPEGGEVWVNARGDGDKVLINVTDTGIGVSSEDAGHVFQKFYRVDNSQTRQIGGTGLGLYLVKQRVEALGGRVWVESAFGDGSTFFVSLPRISDSEYERMKIAQENEQMVQQFAQSGAITSAMVAEPAVTGSANGAPEAGAVQSPTVEVNVAGVTVAPGAGVGGSPTAGVGTGASEVEAVATAGVAAPVSMGTAPTNAVTVAPAGAMSAVTPVATGTAEAGMAAGPGVAVAGTAPVTGSTTAGVVPGVSVAPAGVTPAGGMMNTGTTETNNAQNAQAVNIPGKELS